MALAYDTSGQPVEVPDEQVRDLFLSRKITFKKGDRLPISSTTPAGAHFGTVPAENLADAFQKGWQFDPSGVKQAEVRAKYGTPGQQTIAGLEGLASGATAGLSRPIERAAGVSPAGITGREQANPWTEGIAGVAGAVAPAFVGDEAGLATGVAKMLPTGLISTVGEGVEGALGAKSLAGAVGRGVAEAGLYGASDEASRQMFEGDDAAIPGRAQKILATAGASALFGGAASGFFHVAGALASGAIGKGIAAFAPAGAAKGLNPGSLTDTIDAVTAKAEKDPTTVVGKILDAMIGKDKGAAAGRLFGDRSYRKLAATADSDWNQKIIDGAKAFADHVSTFETAGKLLRDAVKPAEIDKGLAGVDVQTVRERVLDFAGEIRARAEQMRANPADFFNSSKIGQLDAQAEKLESLIGAIERPTGKVSAGAAGEMVPEMVSGLDDKKIPDVKTIWEGLNKAKQNLETISKLGEAIPATERPAAMAAGDLRTALKGMLTDETVFGRAAATQAKYNELLATWIKSSEDFLETKAFGEREGYTGGKPLFDVNVSSIERFFKKLGEPENEARRGAMVQYLSASKTIADQFLEDRALQDKLAQTYGKTQELARLGKAMADLRRVRGTSASALTVIGSPLGRAIIGGITGTAIGGPVGAVAGFAAPAMMKGVMHLMDGIISRNSETIDSFARAIARGISATSERAPQAAAKILDATHFTDQPSKPAKDSREAYRRVAGEIGSLAADPARARALMQAKVAPVAKEAPKHAGAMVVQGLRAVQYLAQQIPPTPTGSPLDPKLGSRRAPSDSDIRNFAQAVKAVNDPLAIMEDLTHGRVSMAGARALRATNPELFGEMKGEILSAITKAGRPISYRMKLQIGLFFGEPVDPTLSPAFIATAQSMYTPPPPMQGAMQPLKSTKDLKSIKAAASASQRIQVDETAS